jgi:hypothetical protein
MKIQLDVVNVCRVETDNGNIFELYDTGSCLEVSLCGDFNNKQDMDVKYVNLMDNVTLGNFHVIRLSSIK